MQEFFSDEYSYKQNDPFIYESTAWEDQQHSGAGVYGAEPAEFCALYTDPSASVLSGGKSTDVITAIFCALFALSVMGLIFIASTIMFN